MKVKLENLLAIHSRVMNEQRNYFTFVLSVFSVAVLPYGFSTDYWSQNFSNMAELWPDENYPIFSGINLFWVTQGVIYLIFVSVMLHSRLMLAAS